MENVARKQLKLDAFIEPTEEEVKSLVTNFVCSANLSFNTVDNNDFKILMKRGFPKLKLPGRRTISAALIKEHRLYMESLISTFNGISYFCVTADCWSAHRRYVFFVRYKSTQIEQMIIFRYFKELPRHNGSLDMRKNIEARVCQHCLPQN